MNKQKILLLSIITTILFTSCVTVNESVKYSDYSYIYNPGAYAIHPQFKVLNENGNETKIYFKIFTQELLYSNANKENLSKALIDIKYKIKPNYKSTKILFSDSITLSLRKQEDQTSIISYFSIKNIDTTAYFIDIQLTDRYTSKTYKGIISVNKQVADYYQYFGVYKEENFKLQFTDFFDSKENLIIKYYDENIKKLYIKYYNIIFEPALPPHTTTLSTNDSLQADTLIEIPYLRGGVFNPTKKGNYKIMSDTTTGNGVCIVKFYTGYPDISSSEQLAQTLVYLLKTNEYDRIINSDNKKLEIDKFWLSTTKDKEKATQLIKIWYNRAIYSNLYFCSYKEGWKTDRGMIYMMFGPPQIINLTDGAERWIYTTGGISENSLSFIFVKEDHVLSNNNYVLKRSQNYQNYWYQAVDTWRNGEVYKY